MGGGIVFVHCMSSILSSLSSSSTLLLFNVSLPFPIHLFLTGSKERSAGEKKAFLFLGEKICETLSCFLYRHFGPMCRDGRIAQLVERGANNAAVLGSSPSMTNDFVFLLCFFCLLFVSFFLPTFVATVDQPSPLGLGDSVEMPIF